MGQKDGEKWTAAADLQPTISKSDRLLGYRRRVHGILGRGMPFLPGIALDTWVNLEVLKIGSRNWGEGFNGKRGSY